MKRDNFLILYFFYSFDQMIKFITKKYILSLKYNSISIYIKLFTSSKKFHKVIDVFEMLKNR